MATIFYSMAGEGRGHATRVRTVVEALADRHRFVLLAPDDAHDYLSGLYGPDAPERRDSVEVRRIPGLRFAYDTKERVHWPKTLARAASYLKGLGSFTRELGAQMERDGADLLVTDYDPGAPRAAERIGLPYVALDHQSLFTFGDLSFLPGRLRRRASVIGRFNTLYYRRQVHTISSSFYRPQPKPSAREVTFVGTMLRPILLDRTPTVGDHVLAYCRRDMPANVLESLADAEREVRVYGLGEQPARGSLTFRAISEEGFVEDLASAFAVVASAGNQLIGECLYLAKPMLALPEAGQDEQAINGVLLERMGGGVACDPLALEGARLREFLAERELYRADVDRAFAHGTPAAVEALEAVLERSAVAAG